MHPHADAGSLREKRTAAFGASGEFSELSAVRLSKFSKCPDYLVVTAAFAEVNFVLVSWPVQ